MEPSEEIEGKRRETVRDTTCDECHTWKSIA